MIQLPPAGLDSALVHDWLEQVAEHVAEFQRNGYELVLADDGVYADGLAAAFDELGVRPPAQRAIMSPPPASS